MTPLKSPGPNEFSTRFYQTYWHLAGKEVSTIVHNFLNEGIFDTCNNFTYIFLIPKIKKPLHASDFRLLSLFNVL